MTGGIGNPDWQRRYVFSAQPLLTTSFTAGITSSIGILDSNGFQYLLFNYNSGGTTAFQLFQILWYKDAAGTVQVSNTEFFPVPNSSGVQRVPVMSRYYKVFCTFISGAVGGNISLLVYGTNADLDNTLTQNTSEPLNNGGVTLGAGLSQTNPFSGMYGGRVVCMIDQGVTNKWSVEVDYFDPNTKAWTEFFQIYGADHGLSFNGDMILPYAPVRLIVFNNDTVARAISWAVVAP